MKKTKTSLIPQETIEGKILLFTRQNDFVGLGGKKVLIDRDLANLYGVETKHLKRQVRRNINRFSEDFMFQLSRQEFENWRC